MQEDNHVFQGLRRDNHQIRQDAKFLWDAHNIRLTNREDNTLLSITNEKGTSDELVTFDGQYVGHCVLGEYLIVFTATINSEGRSTSNRIYRVIKHNSTYSQTILYEDNNGSLNLSPKNPIEAIGCYENNLVQKVYWVDGNNQPRVINIVKEYNNPDGTTFDFIRSLKLNEDIKVFKEYGNGVFAPGVIQYAFTYYNKYEQESEIFYTTPLYYVSPENRGEEADKTVNCSFRIEIKDPDSFQLLRVYSIHRTSLDADPTVKVVSDINISKGNLSNNNSVIIVDDGRKGYTIDNTYLLYLNREVFKPSCIASKDNTLFLGDIKLGNSVPKYESIITPNTIVLSDYELDTIPNDTRNTYYNYTPQLSSANSARFKSNETYRLGIQIQDKTGYWYPPIMLTDEKLCTSLPQLKDGSIKSMSKQITLEQNIVSELIDEGAVRARTCIVFPDINDREVICQGVLCPTVYSAFGRKNSSPFSMSSWFFRPAGQEYPAMQINASSVQFNHNAALYSGGTYGAEIQSMVSGVTNVTDPKFNTKYDTYQNYFFVDENIVTFHSPDLEFDTGLQNLSWDNVKLNIIGMAQLGAIYGDIDIQTSSPTPSGPGFIHSVKGYRTYESAKNNGGLVAGPFYDGAIMTPEQESEQSSSNIGNIEFMVYPWNRSGSLNNDSNRNKVARSAVLSTKKISNLKFFNKNYPFDEPLSYDISTPQLFMADELSIEKLSVPYYSNDILYMGNIDTLIVSKSPYPFFVNNGALSENIVELSKYESNKGIIKETTDPVRMKFKSTPHLVFSLHDTTSYNIPILPRHSSLHNLSGGFVVPSWWGNNSTGPQEPNDDGIESIGDLYYYLPSRGLTSVSNNAIGYYCLMKGRISKIVRTETGSGTFEYPDDLDNKILRIPSGICKVFKPDGLLPDTTEEDYVKYVGDYYFYAGPVRYYTIKSAGTNEQGNKIYELQTYVKPETRALTRTPSGYKIVQKLFLEDEKDMTVPPYLLLAELVKVVDPEVKFGGRSKSAYLSNLWFPSSEPITLVKGEEANIPYKYGDTWYSRYDCLKTYPFTQEDENQIIEIGSFMCETRINIDGRTDKNRGQLSNLSITPQNFNLLNSVYSQRDNFFKYRILDDDYYKLNRLSNQITWSQEKHAGEDIDTWARTLVSNTLDLDGSKGRVTSIKAWNEYLLCFQEKALSQILFNSRVQIPTTDGVPIEISNGYKVDGSRLLSSNIGCSNKWATATTSTGIYFLDSNTDSLYIFNGQLANLSEDRGMDWWVRQNHTDKIWKPVWHNVNTLNGIRAFYDNKYGDIYFTPGQVYGIDQPDALCYSEQLGQFTSLMSYGGTQAMFNFADGFYSLRETDGNVKLYENNVGDYNNFYGETKGWNFSFISNQNPTFTKIFDTIDLRTDHYRTYDKEELLNSCPMNYIEVDNEYQHSGTVLLNSTNMRKKFRVWRGLLPRSKGTRQRIRNPWSMITLGWNPLKTAQPGDNTKKAVVHDVSVKYTI